LNTDGTWTTLASGLSTTAEWSFTNFQGDLAAINLIGCNGLVTKRYDGTTVQDLTGAPAGLQNIQSYANRLYGTVGNIIKLSALRKTSDWTTNNDAGQIVVESGSGQTLIGLKAGNGHITAIKQSSISELYGTGPSNFRMVDAALDIGANSYKSITVFNDQIPFIGKNGIYIYGGGVRPARDYSIPVQNYVLSNNLSNLSKCCAGSDGTKMYFGMPNGAATENNLILQYDPQRQAWYTWENIAVTHIIKVNNSFYMGDSTGRVLLIGGTTDGGVPITWRAVTKPFTADSISRKMSFYRMWVVVDLPAGSTMNISVSGQPKGNNFTLVKTLTTSVNMQSVPVVLPVQAFANLNAIRIKLDGTGPVTIHEINRQMRQMPMNMRQGV
jgi:hypothetical protein